MLYYETGQNGLFGFACPCTIEQQEHTFSLILCEFSERKQSEPRPAPSLNFASKTTFDKSSYFHCGFAPGFVISLWLPVNTSACLRNPLSATGTRPRLQPAPDGRSRCVAGWGKWCWECVGVCLQENGCSSTWQCCTCFAGARRHDDCRGWAS